jgi:hypothetical protein
MYLIPENLKCKRGLLKESLVIQVPFSEELPEKELHKPVPVNCHFSSGPGIHFILQRQQFFIKVVDHTAA